MIDNVSFANDRFIWIILIIALFIWFIFALKEKNNYGRAKFSIHFCISFIAITSLVLIALQPQIHVKKEPQIAAIVTDGYKQTQLDSLKKVNPKLKIYTYKISEKIFNDNKIPSSLYILGHGIKSFDLWQLKNMPANYLGGEKLKGITQLNYESYQTRGNQIQFKGIYNNPTKNNKLLLRDPGGGTLDSLVLTNEKAQLFNVSTSLNVSGRFNFHLVEKDSLGKVLSKDNLPLIIVEKRPLKILVLNGFPTFESKYLKNYLAETGHQVVVKNQLTTARYKYEYFNIANKPVIDITKEKLKLFDLLIIDSKSLKNLSNRERTTLKNVVKESGMGIIIQPDANYFNSKNLIASFKFEVEKNKQIILPTDTKLNIKKYLYQFKDDFIIQAIHSSNSKIWTAYERVGSGRIGLTVIQNTFELILKGHNKKYNTFWSKIIDKISKRKSPSVQWRASDNYVYQDQPYEFELRTTVKKPTVKYSEGYAIPLERDIYVKSLWKGTVYPRKTGWKNNYVYQDSASVFQYCVIDSSQWKSISNFKTVKVNLDHFNEKGKSKIIQVTALKLVNPLWFFVIFILCSSYFWLEPKF